MANASTQTTDNTGAHTAAPAGNPQPGTTQAPAAPPRDAWDKMGVSLDDLPIVGDPKTDTKADPVDGKPSDDGGEPAKTDGQPTDGSELKTKAGRSFKDPTELLSAYENSSSEGIHLAAELKTSKVAHEQLNTRLQEANASLTELQDYVSTTGTFPGAKTPDEVSAMTEEERYNYYSDKRSWDSKRTEYSNRIANAKKEAADYAKSVRATIDTTEKAMAADAAAYPGFSDMADLRTEILTNSPHLDNRSDTPYVSYFIAKGLVAGREGAEKARLERESTDKAKAEADAASRQAGGGAAPADRKPAPKDITGLDRTVAAYQKRRGGF